MDYRVLLLVLLNFSFTTSLISLSDVGDIITTTHEVILDVLQAWKLVSPLLEGEGPESIDLPIIKNKEKKLLSKISQVNRRVEQVDRLIQSSSSASLLSLKEDLPSQIRLELRLDHLIDLVSMINFADTNFKEYTAGHSENDTDSTGPQLERHTLENFATYVVSHSPNSVGGVMDRLHNMIQPDRENHAFLHTGVLQLIGKVLKSMRNGIYHSSDQRKPNKWRVYLTNWKLSIVRHLPKKAFISKQCRRFKAYIHFLAVSTILEKVVIDQVNGFVDAEQILLQKV